MELPQQIDDFIKHSIDNTLGLPIPDNSLHLKIQALERSNCIIRDKYLSLLSKLRQKEEAIDLARGEACMNAQAIKKLVIQCSNLERECSLYDKDREALMEFGNEADKRAKEAEFKVGALEEKLKKVKEELKYYKHQCEMLSGGSLTEQELLNTVVASIVTSIDVAKSSSAFLEASSEIEACSELLENWNRLRPETKNVLSLAAQVQALQKDKEHLITNLHTAEEEVRVLADENSVLDEENKRLRLYNSEKRHASSGGRHGSSTRTKNNKRKTNPVMSSPVDRKIEFSDLDALRCPLSPLKENSPGFKSHKK